MTDDPPALTADLRADIIAALGWHLEAGVDEALEAAPVDRAAADAQAETASGSAPERGAAAAPAREPTSSPAPAPAREPTSTPAAAVEPSAADVAAAAADLDALKAAVDAFKGSRLRAGATQGVIYDGRPDARVMVIGEAPGREEDRAGKPFVGRSGQLLDAMLAEIGLSRRADDPARAVYIANVLPYRPLDNRSPEDSEVAQLLPFLARQVEWLRPSLVLCLGNTPAKHLMGAEVGVTRYRGTWGEVSLGGWTAPALATFHPAYLLRSPEMKRLAWRDLLAFEARVAEISPKA